MSTLTKVLAVILGVVYIIVGVAALIFPGATFVTLSWVWSIMMIVGAILNFILFFSVGSGVPGRGFLLFGAIVQLLLGGILISNGIVFTVVVALNVMQIWILFSGIIGIVGAFEEKGNGVSKWWLTLIFGILLLIVGISSFSSAIFTTALLSVTVGVGLILTGISYISKIFQKPNGGASASF